jgi:hypothetical protein
VNQFLIDSDKQSKTFLAPRDRFCQGVILVGLLIPGCMERQGATVTSDYAGELVAD